MWPLVTSGLSGPLIDLFGPSYHWSSPIVRLPSSRNTTQTRYYEIVFETKAEAARLQFLYVNPLSDLDKACEALGITDFGKQTRRGAYTLRNFVKLQRKARPHQK